jgi:hypothetical protein
MVPIDEFETFRNRTKPGINEELNVNSSFGSSLVRERSRVQSSVSTIYPLDFA